MEWVELLRAEVAVSGVREVARRLGIGASTVSMVCRGIYRRSGRKIKERVMERLYGEVECPVLGRISRLECAKKRRLAREVGARGTGNPLTLRLFRLCPECKGKGVTQ